MKLTKKQEQEILKVYDTWLHSYLNGDTKTYNYYLDKDYHFIGSTGNEEFLNRKATANFFKKTADQLDGKTDIRNDVKIIESFGDLVFITHLLDAWFLSGSKWNFYGRFRFTNVLHETKDGWRFIYQHYSTPDAKAQEGETIGYDQISAENQQLREAILRRTKELEEKNRDLEIETALEKVRAVAMGMQKPEDLSAIGKIIFTELRSLGFTSIRNTEIVINSEKKESVKSYHYSDYGNEEIIEINYKENPIVKKLATDLKKADNIFVPVTIREKQMKEWKGYRKKLGYKTDPKMIGAKSVHYYSYSTGLGALSISTWEKLSKEQIQLLERFRNVFQLSYKRYIDITIAVAQAREAQIEAALERVRSRTMGMRSSAELSAVIKEVTDQVQLLGFDFDTSNIGSSYDENGFYLWNSVPGENVLAGVFIPKAKLKLIDWFYGDKKLLNKSRSVVLNKKDTNAFFNYYLSFDSTKLIPVERKKFLKSTSCISILTEYREDFTLSILNYRGVEYSREESDILKRFANVFEQSYTRFLDLQQAEAQAREAQIQLALERVRARSMAMHHSDEITDVVKLLYKEFDNLKLSNESTDIEIGLIDEETGIAKVWAHLYLSDGSISTFSFPFAHFDEINHEFKRWRSTPVSKRNELFITSEFSGKDWNRFKKLAKDVPELAEMFDSLIKANIKKWVTHNAYFSHGLLTLQGTEHYSPETLEIQKRFAKVFEQTYIRFLDLKKAEEQAREAQIEVAVERVRAKALAMHKSEDLHGVVVTLKKELMGLQIPGVTAVTIYLEHDENHIRIVDLSDAGEKEDDPKHMKLDRILSIEDIDPELWVWRIWNDKRNYCVIEADEDDFKRVVKWLYTIDKKEARMAEKIIKEKSIKKAWLPTVKLLKGKLNIDLLQQPGKEIESILLKMGAGFDLAYKRFLDLQKAEAQAREAEIELGLERVRARAMAMHKSDELLEVANLMEHELETLGVSSVMSGFFLLNENKWEAWMTAPEDRKRRNKFFLPLKGDPVSDERYKHWKKQTPYFSKKAEGKKLRDHLAFVEKFYESEEAVGTANFIPDPTYFHTSNFEYGFIILVSTEDTSEELEKILSRFTQVFSMTYTRFLDLKKAELQAREAQIETGLERVRSRSMAMHQTSELQEVINTVHNELLYLGLSIFGGSFVVINNDVGPELRCWGSGGTANTSEEVLVPHFNMPFCTNLVKGIKSKPGFFTEEFSQKDKRKYFTKLFTQKPWSDLNDKQKKEILTSPGGYTRSVAVSKHTSIFIINHNGKKFAEVENDILKRFAKVFEQSYTRFLDLQKAEAQVREAQIEAALEKVRSRSLAMHSADELQQVVLVIVEKLQELGVILDANGITLCTYFPDSRNVQHWIASPDFTHVGKYLLPYFDHVIFREAWHSKESGDPYFSKEYTGEEKSSFFKHAFEHSDYKKFPEDIKQWILQNDKQVLSFAWQKNSAILIPSNTGVVPTEAEKEILIRFSNVFEQAYVRFMDLQKAEAQAREAQIEAALERVRARAMAMHNSDELKDVAMELRNQMGQLGQKELEVCAIHLYEVDEEFFESWGAMRPPGLEDKIFQGTARFPKSGIKIIDEMMGLYRSGEKDYVIVNEKEKAVEWFDVLKKYSPEVYEAITRAVKDIPIDNLIAYWSLSDFSGGSMLMVTHTYPDKDSLNLLRRSANVFDLAYRRFKDLKKSEEQTRETQIELGLERVRARAMAMQTPAEFVEVIHIIGEQFINLDFDIEWVNFGANGLDISEGIDTWNFAVIPGSAPISSRLFIPRFEHRLFIDAVQQLDNYCKTGNDFFVMSYSKKDKDLWLDHLFTKTIFKGVPEEYQGIQYAKPGYTTSTLALKDTFLSIGKFDTQPFNDEQNAILRRFGNAFGQAFTRFHDLQKAEAQAREAKIESALERVRSRSLAMHHSSELAAVVDTLLSEFTKLEFSLTFCIINLINEQDRSNTVWAANPETGKQPESYYMKFEDYPFHEAMWDAWKKQEKRFIYTIEGEEKKIYDEYLYTHTEFRRFPKHVQDANKALERYVAGFTFFKYSGLQTVSENFISEEDLAILERFGRVFEQSYTRFLDLQKAEAQARESQIQLALERVRARTMAMHKSEELPETSHLLFEQMKELGEPVEQLTIGIIDEENKVVEISATRLGDTLKKIYRHSIDEPYMMNKVYNAWKKQQKALVVELRGDELNAYNKYRNELTKSEMFPTNFGEEHRRIVYASFFSKGMLALGANEPRPTESLQLLERFASVFDLTYTRFLDLQKAEAQAREAQIEAALERVRSRSMGMQKSEELKEVIRVVFDQFVHLNINVDHAGFVVDYIPKGDWHFWIADKNEIPSKITHPYFDSIWAKQFDEAKEKGINFFATHLNFEEKNKFYLDLFKYIPGLSEQSKEFYFNCPGLAASNVLMENVALYIENFSATPYTEEENKILMRFGKVFQQTYTRFLDLQKAEAQAREAQVEAALEKVRSRSMGMQHSDELAEVATMLFQQVKALGVPQWTCGFCIFEIDDKEFTWYPGGPDGEILPPSRIPLLVHPIFIQFNDSRKRGDELFIYEKTGEMQADHYRYMLSLPVVGEYLQSRLDAGEVFPDFQIDHLANFSHGNLVFITYEHFPQMHDIFKRFAKVFDQTYTRFLDLQKAEAQAREAQIEASLERIRSRTMGMQKTDELKEIVALLYEESNKFGFESVLMIINTRREEDDGFNWWFSANEQTVLPQSYFIPDLDEPVLRDIKSIWESGKTDGYIQMGGSLKKEHDRRLFTETGLRELPDHLKEMMRSYESVFLSIANMKNGFIEVAANEFISGDRANILQRYAKVFEQTYTRFLDLQRAEAQAREAQIEAALERVRSRSIAMRKSEEIAEIAAKIFGELRQLDLSLNRVLIWTFNDIEKYSTWWSANPEVESTAESYRINYNDNPVFINYLQAWQKREPIHLFTLSGDTKKNWEDHLFEHTELSRLPMEVRNGMRSEGTLYTVSVISDYGIMMSGSFEPLSEASIDIIQRFGRVFQQSYTRYLDVQKAEVQAREAEIELGLERVRARTMAMQKSDELKEVVQTLSAEIGKLDVIFTRTFLVIYEPDTLSSTWWMSNPETNESFGLFVKYHEHAPYRAHLDAWRERKKAWQYVLEGDDKKQWDHFLFNETDLSLLPAHVKDDMQGKEKVCLSCSFSNFGYLVLESPDSISSEQFDILYRFAKVFDLTYTRFLDIQKAETQAKEAQIEAALERVRGKVTSMQESSELLEIVVEMRSEFVALGHHADYFWYMRWMPEKYEKAMTSGDGTRIGMVMELPRHIHGNIKLIDDWEKSNEPAVVFPMDVDTAVNYVDKMIRLGDFKQVDPNAPTLDDIRHIGGLTFVMARTAHGEIGYSLAGPVPNPPAADIATLVRFAGVFDLAYRRFEDLKESERRNKETQIELALEKVRSRTMAMQRSDELAETAAVLFQQLILMGIEPNRLYISIIQNDAGDSEFWITDEDGSKVSSAYTANLNENISFRKMLDGWRSQKKSLIIDMHGEELQEYFQHLNRLHVPFKGGLTQTRRVQHLAFFSKGFIGMASPDEQSKETMQLLERFAAVFNLTFTRFSDLKIAEAHALKAEQDLIEIKDARTRAEVALAELQATQKQLVQSEKMASLGELTAGIAHEIQNPLNFVNNFSDVSTELLEEMKAELEKGNTEDVRAIAEDIRQNLEKILHHGKRADGIVKGMLQHSRTSAGQKDLIDINALCDEYLRLAYHGLRAKDKSFNAKFETSFGNDLEKISVVPQDIGRVILNLINNAFYAVHEKAKENIPGYEPIVTVSTKMISSTGGNNGEEKMEISIKDNGNGIPDTIIEKIFQPFFTTKPTGQGTGLGLSLSYDLIKSHGGEILVKSARNRETEFRVLLPVS